MPIAVCPCCDTGQKFSYRKVRLSVVGTVRCGRCGSDFSPEPEATARRPSDNQKRSRRQEKGAAKRYGGRVQPASGALPGAKGDIHKKGVLRGECKFTRARSYSLKLDELLKLMKEAKGFETPLFEIEFQGVYPPQRFVVLSERDFAQLKQQMEKE